MKTIEEKAKAYDEAIERAKQIRNGNPSSGTAIVVCEQIFPELRESEDEKTRKKLLALIKWSKSYAASGVTVEDANEMADYLDKQKEQNPINSFDIVPYIDDKIAALQDMWREEKVAFDWDDMHEMIEDVARHFYQKEQKPAWSEEDENMLADTYFKLAGFMGNEKNINWIKSLRPQPKKEWNKEDKEKLYQVIGELYADKEIAIRECPSCKALHESYDDMIAFLKSLHPSWKPSEDEERLINTSISFLKDFADKGYENAVECIDWLKSKLKNGDSGK